MVQYSQESKSNATIAQMSTIFLALAIWLTGVAFAASKQSQDITSANRVEALYIDRINTVLIGRYIPLDSGSVYQFTRIDLGEYERMVETKQAKIDQASKIIAQRVRLQVLVAEQQGVIEKMRAIVE